MTAQIDEFNAALSAAAVETAKRGARVYPENGRVRVLVGPAERRTAAKAIGAELEPAQPSGDQAHYIRMPTCILVGDRALPLVRESVETVVIPEGYEVYEAGRGTFWGDDRDAVYRLRPSITG